ncbi:MAG TPA: NmrA family NAD(P)-binding protein [Nitrospira sp.]|nr:NmrA family NAD(P)-binding protein [Nitrospira sp.]
MTDKKTIAVAGATGAQGGGLVRAIVNNPGSGFVARALTRDVNSDKAKALAKLGVEVVAANLDDLDSMQQAFSGAHGAFCVTNYWEHLSPEREQAHARTMAEAAKHAGVQHVIWSTLEDTRKWVPLTDNRMPTLMGKYKVPHFDAKGESDRESMKHGVPTRYNDVSPETYRSFGFPGADDIGNMFQFKRDFNEVFCGARGVAFTRSLNPLLQDFQLWLDRNKSRIPLS